MSKRVGLITNRKLGGLDAEDAPLPVELQKLGIVAEPLAWDDPAVKWEQYALCVVRSPWDYFQRYAEFLGWLHAVQHRTTLLNPPAVLEWNSHKRYLLELARRGVPVMPTELLELGGQRDVAAVCRRHGWTEIVVKPAVSGGAWRTARHTDLDAAQRQADELLRDGDVLVQPYDPEVSASGERSLVFIEGQLAHAVRKRSAFELKQELSRAEVTKVPAPDDEVALARQTLAAAWPSPLLYARVDLLRGAAGKLRLMELEVLEPSLYLRQSPETAVRLAQAIARRLG